MFEPLLTHGCHGHQNVNQMNSLEHKKRYPCGHITTGWHLESIKETHVSRLYFFKQKNIHQHWILWKLCWSLGLPNPFRHLHSSSCCVSPVIIPKHKRSVKLIKYRRHVWPLNLEVVSKKPGHTLVICPISVAKATKKVRSVGYDFSASTMF